MLRSEHGHNTSKDKNSSRPTLPRRCSKKQLSYLPLVTHTDSLKKEFLLISTKSYSDDLLDFYDF